MIDLRKWCIKYVQKYAKIISLLPRRCQIRQILEEERQTFILQKIVHGIDIATFPIWKIINHFSCNSDDLNFVIYNAP